MIGQIRRAAVGLLILAASAHEGADRLSRSVVLGQTQPEPGAPIPYNQDRAPNPPRSPEEAARAMMVPPGFQVEVVASEPEIVNPVAMTFDERGRIWITESLEYPRRAPGRGRDRVKILEDRDGDGRTDRFTVFAEGLNIPSGIAVGHGGVWVANSPDILFFQDRDGDGKAEVREVVVTGFGRFDTHELPNSLTWGPDGWLYGWNGVFNPGKVVSRNGKTYEFTCAIFRIHPRTRVFEVWCEGTSNPWGIAIDPEGSFFASACVIDHLWHVVETGYYIRQGGPYPAFTWPIGSIVHHTHQKAAYCGIHYFDSTAYPPEYRGRLYMGNIHGNCVNVDVLERNGSTYRAKPAADFLRANDAWFMPVAQQTGPDGCLYILDWYDRYHCYQDANRDPAGIDRNKGRLYRVRYKDAPRRIGFDLASASDDALVGLLGSANVYDRNMALRLLTERMAAGAGATTTRVALEALVTGASDAPRDVRVRALWVLIGSGRLDAELHHQLLTGRTDPALQAWAVRAAGDMGRVDARALQSIARETASLAPEVLLQVAIAAPKLDWAPAMSTVKANAFLMLMAVLRNAGNDPLIPRIVWQNLHPMLQEHARDFVRIIRETDLKRSPGVAAILPRAMEKILATREVDPSAVASLLGAITEASGPDSDTARGALVALAGKLIGDDAERARGFREPLRPVLERLIARAGPNQELARLLTATWQDARGLDLARTLVGRRSAELSLRRLAFLALVGVRDRTVLGRAATVLAERHTGREREFQSDVLSGLGRLDEPEVADVVLRAYRGLAPALKPRAVELLTQRPGWAKALLAAVAAKQIPTTALDVTQLRKLQQGKDPEVALQIKTLWGTVRDARNPERERIAGQIRSLVRATPGDPVAGQSVFQRICAQCHKIYGEGQDVGPEITSNGRNDFEQLISNVFDPSLVIGPGYQATTVATTEGRVLTGLLVEDGRDRVALKLQGGKIETIPRDQIDELKTSGVSLMPEEFERQLAPQEIADLCAFLCLDKPPSDPTAKPLPGSGPIVRRSK
jgi:putative heme-binding domain-containing protein